MKLAFCLFKYFPFGGLQRDFLRIAKECRSRGHDVHVYTMQWEGPIEPDFHLHLLPQKNLQNHTKSFYFAQHVESKLRETLFDLVIGFNKMPNLDIYYAADVCYQARVKKDKGFLYRLLPRYQQWLSLEKAVFKQGQNTRILLISPFQEKEFSHYYQTEPERFHLLPPGIHKECLAPDNASEIRHTVREAYDIQPSDLLLLMVGSGFKTKGVDRTIQGLAALPADMRARCHLWIIGQGNPAPFLQLARKLGVHDKVQFLGGRPDVPQFLLAADVLLHPAYHENTGTVILEAMAAGLPVLTTANCGYAHHVAIAQAGFVVPMPYEPEIFNDKLMQLLKRDRKIWQQNALNYALWHDLYSMPQKAVDLIERLGTST